MGRKIEIYIRHNENGAMLNFHVPKEFKSHLLRALEGGELDLTNEDANFESIILPEWIAGDEPASAHVRLKISSLNINYYEEGEL